LADAGSLALTAAPYQPNYPIVEAETAVLRRRSAISAIFGAPMDRVPERQARSTDRRRTAVSRIPVFNSPLLLGFDHFEQMLDRVSKTSADGYPPYNIEQVGEEELRITLAVAGFTMDNLEVTIEDNQLVIRGRQVDDDSHRVYLHRGIAARQFQRNFILAEGIEVTSARLEDGLLHIDLVRPIPEPQVRRIKIENSDKAKSKPQTIDVE
jgi:HSP20 family molecular chaperone IbpA|tara:strand:+ start:1575 stop:2204 length:630 start_codon:yes stop_codon:yes gene_type:complete